MNINNLKIETVGQGLYVCTSQDHKFGTDSFLVSNFSAPRNKDIVCDLGTGCGIIPVLLHRDFNPKKIYAIYIQQSAVDLAKQTAIRSNLQDKIIVKQADIKNITNLPLDSFDVVVCNPPYKSLGSGVISKSSSDKIARHETACTIEDVCFAAKKLLKFSGRLCLCQRAERLADTIFAMRKFNIEPKSIRFCAKDKNTSPWMFLIEGKKGSKPFLKVLPLLEAYEKNGEFTEELKKIYGWGGKF